MTLWMNVEEAREFLLKNGFVYTLRPKVRKVGGIEALMWGKQGKRGEVIATFLGEIKQDCYDCLLDFFLYGSGFESVDQWKNKANGSRFLYQVKLRRLLISTPEPS